MRLHPPLLWLVTVRVGSRTGSIELRFLRARIASMAGETRLSHLFVLVSDLERARRFYVDELGLDLLMETPGYIRVGGGGGFHLGIEAGRPENVSAPGIEIVIEVDDVDRRYQELVASGVRFSGPPEDQEWGARHAWLIDPDGHRLSIYSAPAVP
jgi:catechol 2,3-dioxygenase-like lactoylglutathione lyase family enzyme